MDEFGYPIDSNHLESGDDERIQNQEPETPQTTLYTNGTGIESPQTSVDIPTESPFPTKEVPDTSTAEEEIKNTGVAALGAHNKAQEDPTVPNEQSGSAPSAWLGSSVTGWLGLAKAEDSGDLAEGGKKAVREEKQADASLISSVTGWLGLREEQHDNVQKTREEGRETVNSFTSAVTGWLGFGGDEKTDHFAEKEQDQEGNKDEGQEPAEKFRSRRISLNLEGSQLQEEEKEELGTLAWLGKGLSKQLGFGFTNGASEHEKTNEREEEEAIQAEQEQPESSSWYDMGIGNIMGFRKDNSVVEESTESNFNEPEKNEIFEQTTGSEKVNTSQSQGALMEEGITGISHEPKVEEILKYQNDQSEEGTVPGSANNNKENIGTTDNGKSSVLPADTAAEDSPKDVSPQNELEDKSQAVGGFASVLSSLFPVGIEIEEEHNVFNDNKEETNTEDGEMFKEKEDKHQLPKSAENMSNGNKVTETGEEMKTTEAGFLTQYDINSAADFSSMDFNSNSRGQSTDEGQTGDKVKVKAEISNQIDKTEESYDASAKIGESGDDQKGEESHAVAGAFQKVVHTTQTDDMATQSQAGGGVEGSRGESEDLSSSGTSVDRQEHASSEDHTVHSKETERHWGGLGQEGQGHPAELKSSHFTNGSIDIISEETSEDARSTFFTTLVADDDDHQDSPHGQNKLPPETMWPEKDVGNENDPQSDVRSETETEEVESRKGEEQAEREDEGEYLQVSAQEKQQEVDEEKQDEMEEFREDEKEQPVKEIKEEEKQEEIEVKQEEVVELKEEENQQVVKEVEEDGKQEEIEEVKQEETKEVSKVVKERKTKDKAEEIKEEQNQRENEDFEDEVEEVKQKNNQELMEKEGEDQAANELKEYKGWVKVEEEEKQQQIDDLKEEKQEEVEKESLGELKEMEEMKEEKKESEDKLIQVEMGNGLHSSLTHQEDTDRPESEWSRGEADGEDSNKSVLSERSTLNRNMEDEVMEEVKEQCEKVEDERRDKEEKSLTCSNESILKACEGRVLRERDGEESVNRLGSKIETGNQYSVSDGDQISVERTGVSQSAPSEGMERDEDREREEENRNDAEVDVSETSGSSEADGDVNSNSNAADVNQIGEGGYVDNDLLPSGESSHLLPDHRAAIEEEQLAKHTYLSDDVTLHQRDRTEPESSESTRRGTFTDEDTNSEKREINMKQDDATKNEEAGMQMLKGKDVISEQRIPHVSQGPVGSFLLPGGPTNNIAQTGGGGAFGLFQNAYSFFTGTSASESTGTTNSLNAEEDEASKMHKSLTPEQELDSTADSAQVHLQDPSAALSQQQLRPTPPLYIPTSPSFTEALLHPSSPSPNTGSPLLSKRHESLLSYVSVDEKNMLTELFGRHKLQFLEYILGSSETVTDATDNDESILLDIERLLHHHRETVMGHSMKLEDTPQEDQGESRMLIALQKIEMLLAKVRETFATRKKKYQGIFFCMASKIVEFIP